MTIEPSRDHDATTAPVKHGSEARSLPQFMYQQFIRLRELSQLNYEFFYELNYIQQI